MKKLMMPLFLGLLFIGQLSVAHALDIEENSFLQASDEKLVKVNLDETTLTVFLIDTSRTMRGNGIQTTINVVVDGEQYGNILGGGVTAENEKAELYAIPSENGEFDGWMKDNELISTDLACDYTVTGESTLVAKFSARGDDNAKK